MPAPFRQSVWDASSPHAEAGRRLGAQRPRIVFVHGSVMGGRPTWSGQRSLADRFRLEIVERPGFPPNPPVDHVDFEEHALLVADTVSGGAHLVGHSYGGVISLLAAAAVPESVRSLTVIEPPATRLARGNPAADRFTAEGRAWWATGPTDDPEAFLRGFLTYIGSNYSPPSPLPDQLEQGARTLIVERGPWEAEIPLDALVVAPFPVLVVSGGHHAGFDAVCDVLVDRLGAERLVLSGYGHTAQRNPAFNERLAEFVTRAEALRRG
jgi:pimeloyl-ACP methyl ester carboxylesterase